jgi:hypothetical protein
MRFACIEYNTKSGGIWAHKPELPNYLADHQREIDATSYGTWTSALEGEHVPLSWFIEAKRGPGVGEKYRLGIRIKLKLNARRGRPLIEFSNLDYADRFDAVLICFHPYGYKLMTELVQALRERFPKLVIIGTHATFGLGLLREHWKSKEWFSSFRTFMDACDVFAVANREAVGYLSLISETPVQFLPHFYPLEYALQFGSGDEPKDKTIFVAGDTSRGDVVWGCLLAKEIQSRHPEFVIQVIGSESFNYVALEGSRYEVLPRTGWTEYLHTVAKSFLVINTDVQWTNGRVQSDCAAMMTPCLGVNAGWQTELFPELAIPEFEGSDQAMELADKLIASEDYYTSVSKFAFEKISGWSYPNGNRKVREVVAEVQAARGS